MIAKRLANSFGGGFSLKEALKIIGDIDASTMTTALPPPVDTGDLDLTDSYKPSRLVGCIFFSYCMLS